MYVEGHQDLVSFYLEIWSVISFFPSEKWCTRSASFEDDNAALD